MDMPLRSGPGSPKPEHVSVPTVPVSSFETEFAFFRQRLDLFIATLQETMEGVKTAHGQGNHRVTAEQARAARQAISEFVSSVQEVTGRPQQAAEEVANMALAAEAAENYNSNIDALAALAEETRRKQSEYDRAAWDSAEKNREREKLVELLAGAKIAAEAGQAILEDAREALGTVQHGAARGHEELAQHYAEMQKAFRAAGLPQPSGRSDVTDERLGASVRHQEPAGAS